MKYILDICSGSQSLRTLCNDNIEYVGLDINEKSNPSILINLLEKMDIQYLFGLVLLVMNTLY